MSYGSKCSDRLLAKTNVHASETHKTVMGNSQQSSAVRNRDWAMAVEAASSPAPTLLSNMFSALRHLDDCGDEGRDSHNDAPFVEQHSRRFAKRRRRQSRQPNG